GTLADDDVEAEVLERGIEDLLDRAVKAVDLIDEQDVVALEAREDRCHVALPLESRAGDAADPDSQLFAHDVRERRLAKSRRTDEQNVVERLVARLRRLQRDRQLSFQTLLSDELVESPRPQGLLELFVLQDPGGF